ncbi:DUF819 domain-containing protein [Clostridioides difficile]|uniref:DUF819 family protein n=1 Tax=Clostridioides difficile TaxID=1496 RepID=UPI0010333934|nr:DUF819 family protein [Clostridioides difficile]
MVDKLKWKVFDVINPMLLIYLGSAILGSFGLFAQNEDVGTYQNIITVNFLPLMLVFLLIQCDLRKILKMGPKILLSFFCATFTFMLGFVIAFIIFKNSMGADSWKILGAASGSWIGGSSNMIAAANALGVAEEGLSYAILMGSIGYTVWMSVCLMSVKFGPKFNKWTKCDTSFIDEVTSKLEKENKDNTAPTFVELMILLSVGFGVASFAQIVSKILPTSGILNETMWVVLVASTVSILLGMTKISKLKGSTLVGNVFMYLLLAATGSKANFFRLSEAPVYIMFGLVVVLVHAISFIGLAKLFKLDLFTCEVGSIANIGGVTTAPMIAGVHNPVLIPVGVLIGLLGNIIGTYCALMVTQILHMLA